MSIVFIEGFDHYTDFNTQYHGKWISTSANNVLAAGRCDGSYALSVHDPVTMNMKNPYTYHITVGAAVYFGDFQWIYEGTRRIIGFLSPGAEIMSCLCVNKQGQLNWQEEVNGTYAPWAVTGDSVVTNRWHYIEVTAHSVNARKAGGNYVDIYIDGKLAGHADGAPMGDIHWYNSPYSFAAVILHGPNSYGAAPNIFDDMYIMDDNPAGHTTPLGDRRVLTVFPTEDDTVEFIPSSGVVNFEMVNDPGPDEDGTYNHSDVVGARDVFLHEQLGTEAEWVPCKGMVGPPLENVIIDGVQISARAKKTEIGNRLISPFMISDASETAHVQQSIANDYRYRYEVFEKDPATDSDWTIAALNASKVGYQAD